jgi:hypothetical protein
MSSTDLQTKQAEARAFVGRKYVTKIPTHLHEGRFAKFDAGDSVVAEIVAAQRRARGEMERILEVHELRMDNPLQTRIANLKASKSHAERRMLEALRVIDRQRERTAKVVETLEGKIEAELANGARRWELSGETRARFNAMRDAERQKFIDERFAEADVLALGAILGVPGYLSGLSEGRREVLLHRYRQTFHGEDLARVEALREAQKVLDDGGSAMLTNVAAMFADREIAAAEAKEARVREAESG